MGNAKIKVSREEIRAALGSDRISSSPQELADILGLGVKTIYDWKSRGFLDGTFRKRGKHILFWSEKALDRIFNGPEWNDTGASGASDAKC